MRTSISFLTYPQKLGRPSQVLVSTIIGAWPASASPGVVKGSSVEGANSFSAVLLCENRHYHSFIKLLQTSCSGMWLRGGVPACIVV
ncbi:hypothetical protein BU25DRAFT_150420 [Macroventuria anomochaeta]|uniref:Uncharacterized protein n=1 Tax=Macroventuria anomochaeta TaxID=301207 RepID=A0ACB6SDZ7_9PLEO|nr:uncharacterized protein BU25DRAFT_150420 [Macroventuria anomochaeta]KAF2632381.1 hypothetical protein BU25DRAFT_150420 [Macroventuria anomochaeta]